MTLEDFKNALYKERQAIDALATTVKSNATALMAIVAAVAIPFVPAIFSANGVYTQTSNWSDAWRNWAAIAIAVAIEGAGMTLSVLATKTYSAWRKGAATQREVWAMSLAVILYTVIVIVLIGFSDIPTGLKFIVGLIPVLGVAFYIGMGFETDLANRLDEAAEEKRKKSREKRAKRNTQRNTQKTGKNTGVDRRQAALNIIRENPQISGAKLGQQLGVSDRTGQNILSEFEQAGVIHRNGEGWRVK
jgi:hypothetical protein